MKKVKKSLIALSVALAAMSMACENMSKSGRTTSDLPPLASDIKIKTIILGEGKQLPKIHNALSVIMKIKNEKDSILMDFTRQKQPLVMEKDSTWNTADNLFAVLNRLAEGDSVHVSLPAIKAFNGRTPPTVDADDVIKLEIRIDRIYENAIVYHKENWESEMKKIIEDNEALIPSQEKLVKDWLNKEGLEAKKTKHGVFYVVEKEGEEGTKIQPFDRVKIHYTLRNFEGKIIDTSVEEIAKEAGSFQEGRQYEPYPVVIGVSQVIKGWHEGIPYFKKAGKGKLIIPSYFAYGERGYPPNIKANEVLVFDIEIFDIEPSDVSE